MMDIENIKAKDFYQLSLVVGIVGGSRMLVKLSPIQVGIISQKFSDIIV